MTEQNMIDDEKVHTDGTAILFYGLSYSGLKCKVGEKREKEQKEKGLVNNRSHSTLILQIDMELVVGEI